MLVYFEDWSIDICLDRLEQKGLPHGGRVIKAFASGEDPRQVLGRESLKVVGSCGAEFQQGETFEYEGRGTYSDAQLEAILGMYGLNALGNRTARALFRFANEHGFCQAAMQARQDDHWLITHPLEDIDGLDAKRPASFHLDIFFPESLVTLREILDYDDPNLLVDWREGVELRTAQAAGPASGS